MFARPSHGENRGSSPLGSAPVFNHLADPVEQAERVCLLFVYCGGLFATTSTAHSKRAYASGSSSIFGFRHVATTAAICPPSSEIPLCGKRTCRAATIGRVSWRMYRMLVTSRGTYYKFFLVPL
jgi:hypothetical protein